MPASWGTSSLVCWSLRPAIDWLAESFCSPVDVAPVVCVVVADSVTQISRLGPMSLSSYGITSSPCALVRATRYSSQSYGRSSRTSCGVSPSSSRCLWSRCVLCWDSICRSVVVMVCLGQWMVADTFVSPAEIPQLHSRDTAPITRRFSRCGTLRRGYG